MNRKMRRELRKNVKEFYHSKVSAKIITKIWRINRY